MVGEINDCQKNLGYDLRYLPNQTFSIFNAFRKPSTEQTKLTQVCNPAIH